MNSRGPVYGDDGTISSGRGGYDNGGGGGGGSGVAVAVEVELAIDHARK